MLHKTREVRPILHHAIGRSSEADERDKVEQNVNFRSDFHIDIYGIVYNGARSFKRTVTSVTAAAEA